MKEGCDIPRWKSTCPELSLPPPKKVKGQKEDQKAFPSDCEDWEAVKRMKGIRKETEHTVSLLLWVPDVF